MFIIRNLFGREDNHCRIHKMPLSYVCYSRYCSQRFLCSHSECLAQHQNHTMTPIKEYGNRLSRFEAEVTNRQRIIAALEQHIKLIHQQVQTMCEEARVRFLSMLSQTCYSKDFLTAMEKHKLKQDFAPELYSLPQQSTKQLADEMVARMHSLQRKVREQLTTDTLCLGTKQLGLVWRPEQLKEKGGKMDQLLELLPFHCKPTLKFQASKNRFITKNLYSLQLKGPILVLVQSKLKTFGGFSPVMFTQRDEYIEDKKAESFLFSLDDCQLMPIKPEEKKYAVKGGPNWSFGRGDLTISQQGNKSSINWSDVGQVYHRQGIHLNNEKRWLAGTWYFKLVEYQVFEIREIRKK